MWQVKQDKHSEGLGCLLALRLLNPRGLLQDLCYSAARWPQLLLIRIEKQLSDTTIPKLAKTSEFLKRGVKPKPVQNHSWKPGLNSPITRRKRWKTNILEFQKLSQKKNIDQTYALDMNVRTIKKWTSNRGIIVHIKRGDWSKCRLNIDQTYALEIVQKIKKWTSNRGITVHIKRGGLK